MRKMLFFACLLLGLSACEKDPDMNQLDADLVVYTDYDKDADFGGYKTYFLPDSILEAGGHRATYWKDENAKAIINKVAAEMDARGYTRILDPEKKEEANVGLQLSGLAAFLRGSDNSGHYRWLLGRLVGLWFLGSLVRMVLSVSRILFL